MLYAIMLLILGALSASSVIIKNKPNAKEILDKFTPYQGWIGVVFTFWGVWGVIQQLINIGGLTKFPILWLTFTAGSVLEAILGFLLGFSLIALYMGKKNEAAAVKAEELQNKLIAYQIPLGFTAIGLAIWWIVVVVIF